MAKKIKEVSSAENGSQTAIVSDETTGTTISKENWQGFCEIESEPAYFSAILRDIGVEDVTVREVFALTPDLLDILPQPIYGLILLFRYREFGKEDQATNCPRGVWFANQLPGQNSCGTLAMTNILMNTPEVKVGEHLAQFKDFTRDLTPFQRGEAFASFDYVKKIHNSFAKKMDILENDKHLSYKVKRAKLLKDRKQPAKPKTVTATTTSTSRSRARRHSPDSAASDDSAESFEENGHHFIAFVPVGNSVYKLDGMDAQPIDIGTFDAAAGETWLSVASETINTLMAAGDDDYGVIALAQSPLSANRKKAALGINTASHIDARLDTLSPSWRSDIDDSDLPSPRLLGVEEILIMYPVPPTLAAEINAETSEELLSRRFMLMLELKDLQEKIMEDMNTEAEEEEKASMRRFDSGPAIKVWLEMLAANGYLEENLKRFMGKSK
ncbi:cysteine proteinase [Phaeosphaeriaceae sp. SRC1lsM3a]|nr:cysteine proteinase [Stagonospora sp. SRC1lsM3a]